MWPYPIRELEAYTKLAVRHTVEERAGGGRTAYWARPQAHHWQTEEDWAWNELNRVAGDALTRDNGALTSMVWAAAWKVANHSYHCDEDSARDWEKFTEGAQKMSDVLAAHDLACDIKWLVWNCAWAAVRTHRRRTMYVEEHWNAGHHAASALSAIFAPFTFGLSLAALAALPYKRRAIHPRETDYDGDRVRMEAHASNLRRRQAHLANVYRRADAEGVAQLRLLVLTKVRHLELADKVLEFLWTP